MKTIEDIIMRVGKVDKKYIDYQPKTMHKRNLNDLIYEVHKPAVLFEKIGNENKGVVTGLNAIYRDVERSRMKHRDQTNVFKMWVEGKIEGSVVVSSECGFVFNQLNGETYYGCWYPFKDDFTGLEYLFHQ